MPRPRAEQLRAHREAFVLAQQLGCTPAEAAAELRRREARDRWDAARRRLEAKMAMPLRRPAAAAADDDGARDSQPWMMRD